MGLMEQKEKEGGLGRQADFERFLFDVSSSFVSLSMDGYRLADCSGRVLDVNETYCAMSGYGRDELLGTNIADFDADEESGSIAGHIERVTARGQERFETRHRRRDGGTFEAEISTTYTAVDGGRYVSFVRDITERKNKEAEANARQMHFAEFLDSAHEPVSYWRMPENLRVDLPLERQKEMAYEAVCVDVNRAFQEGFGFNDRSEMVGRRYLELVTDTSIDRALEAFLKNGYQIRDFEISHQRPDRRYHALASWHGMVRDGCLTHIWAFAKVITRERATKMALARSEQLVNEIASQIPGAVYQFRADAKGEFTIDFMSGGGKEMFDMSMAELLDPATLQTAIVAEDAEALWASVRRSMEEMSPWEHRFRVLRGGDKSVRWMWGRSIPHRENDGSTVWNGILLDVTEHKQADDEKQRNQEKYQTLFEAMLDGYAMHEIIVDDDGKPVDYRFMDVNPAFERMTGLSREQVIGRTVREVLPGIESYWIERYGNVALTGEPLIMEEYSGELEKYFEVSAFCPKRGYFVCVFLDVTERRLAQEELARSQERFELAARGSNDGIWDWECFDSDVCWWSDRLFEILGYEPGEFEPKISFWKQAIHPDDAPTVLGAMEDHLEKGTPYQIEFRRRKKNGEYAWLLVRAESTRDEHGKAIRMTGAVTDITERKLAEQRLAEHRAELAHVWRVNTLGEMATGIVHELAQPLCAIQSFASGGRNMIAGGAADMQRVHDVLCKIVAEAGRAGEIIRRIRMMAARRTPVRSTVNINDLVADVLRLAEPEIRQSSTIVSRQFAGGLPGVRADHIEIEEVVLNLVRNALQAMSETPRQKRRITIRTALTGGGDVEVSVSDNGHGFEADEAETIFESFYTTKPDGLGVGLSLSRAIIDMHQGRIWGERDSEGGATFRFTLPVDGGGEGTDEGR